MWREILWSGNCAKTRLRPKHTWIEYLKYKKSPGSPTLKAFE